MNYADIHDSLVRLKAQNSEQYSERFRIRSILDGGASGMYALMAWDMGKGASMETAIADITDQFGIDLPTVNMMDSGLTRLAQKVGRSPTLKPPKAQGETVIEQHQKRIDLMRDWDRMGRVHLQSPQTGRWLPGYSFVGWQLKQRRGEDGKLFPVMELQDPFDMYPGWLGPDQRPIEYATVRRIPLTQLVHALGDAEEAARVSRTLQQNSERWSFLSEGTRTWEGVQSGVEIIEYENPEGKVVCIPEAEHIISYEPNVTGIRQFNFAKRYSFNKQISQYHHIIGIMAAQTKLNILSLIATEDSVLTGVDIVGEVESGEYEFGRDAVNLLSPGSQVVKQTGGTNHVATFQAIDRLERQLRIGAQYDVQQDGQSPNSFATGMGMRELQGAVTDNVREYHVVLRDALEENDSIRYQFAESVYKSEQRKYFDMRGKKQVATINNVIDGDYRTRRIYGAMATFDDHQKIIVGMQLETAGAMDMLTFQENIDGFEDLELMNERITRKQYKEVLMSRLLAKSEQDPAADAVLVAIMKDPDKEIPLLEEYFGGPDPEEQAQMEAAQQAQMMAQQGGGPVGVPPPGGSPEMADAPVQSILSRIEGSGAVDGGVQSVAVQ
jgi:hypothetical protein